MEISGYSADPLPTALDWERAPVQHCAACASPLPMLHPCDENNVITVCENSFHERN